MERRTLVTPDQLPVPSLDRRSCATSRPALMVQREDGGELPCSRVTVSRMALMVQRDEEQREMLTEGTVMYVVVPSQTGWSGSGGVLVAVTLLL